jgi:hypothetical protein
VGTRRMQVVATRGVSPTVKHREHTPLSGIRIHTASWWGGWVHGSDMGQRGLHVPETAATCPARPWPAPRHRAQGRTRAQGRRTQAQSGCRCERRHLLHSGCRRTQAQSGCRCERRHLLHSGCHCQPDHCYPMATKTKQLVVPGHWSPWWQAAPLHPWPSAGLQTW